MLHGQQAWLQALATPATVGLMCHVRQLEDETYVKLDRARLLAWLRVKVAQLRRTPEFVSMFSTHSVRHARSEVEAPTPKSPSRSATPRKSATPKKGATPKKKRGDCVEEDTLLLQCIGLVSEWLPQQISDMLIKSYGFSPSQAVSGQLIKRGLEASLAPEMPRKRSHEGGDDDCKPKQAAKTHQSQNIKRLQQGSTKGQRSLASMFGAKPKPKSK